MTFRMLVCCVALLGLTSGCAKQTIPDTRAEDESLIREVEIEQSKAMAAKDLDHMVSFYADDASLLDANTPIATGKDAIREIWKAVFAGPGFGVSSETLKVEVSRSGDLAYTRGTYTMTANDAKGNPVTDKGKYVGVYKKQPDGQQMRQSPAASAGHGARA